MKQDYLRLKRYRVIWRRKKIIRTVYRDWYAKINHDLKPGKTLELGSGTGNFKQFNHQIISSDIVPCEWLDRRIDAHKIPFPKKSLSNIVMIDVLHHLISPWQFFAEAQRVLKPDGRIIMIEPFPGPFSLIIYTLFHPEPFNFQADVFSGARKRNKKPWESNQAIPYLLFFKHLKRTKKLFEGKFIILKRQKFSFLLYPLSGGFENKQLIPDWLVPFFGIIEKLLYFLKDILAFRCYVILQKIE